MQMKIYGTRQQLAEAAAQEGAKALREALATKGTARLIAATGAAQFEFLDALLALPGIDWAKVELFHLDEYLGIDDRHPASFCRFLRERLIEKAGIEKTHLLDGTASPEETIRKVTHELRKSPVDIAFIGIGENGHLAFNDPPADFETDEAFIVVELDKACRQQQFGEGWFPSLEAVPTKAISMTVKQILAAKQIVAIVPDLRKAQAVADCFNGGISPQHPASILRTHGSASLYLDSAAASLLKPEVISNYRLRSDQVSVQGLFSQRLE
jgi:glucosamine-6-phosphate deaminase